MLSKPKTDEDLYTQMQDGIAHATASRIVGPLLDARRKTLIQNAVNKARSLDPEKRATKDDAYVFLMALASTYDLEDDLTRKIADGQKAGQHFTR